MIRIILLIALAVAVGASLGILLAQSTKRRQGKTTTYVAADQKPPPVLPWLVGLVVLFVGLWLLADHDRSSKDTRYHPAELKNGTVQPGYFAPRNDNTSQ